MTHVRSFMLHDVVIQRDKEQALNRAETRTIRLICTCENVRMYNAHVRICWNVSMTGRYP